jgi:hypothetical protein
MREKTVLITLTPVCNNDILCDGVEAFWFFSKKGEVLVFIGLVYSQKINNLRRIS